MSRIRSSRNDHRHTVQPNIDRDSCAAYESISRARCCLESLERRTLLAAGIDPIRIIDGVEVATIDWQGQRLEMLAGRWIVQLDGYAGNLLDQQAQAAQVIEAADSPFRVSRHLGADGLFLVTSPVSMNVQDVVAGLSQVPGFKLIEPDFRYELTLTPNDPSYGSMWGLNNTGQSGGTVDADIDAPEAWDKTTGSSSVVVGMVDSGIDWNHPDLNDRIWINSLEIPGNGIDDDGNGYIDDVRGWDFWSNDNNPADENNHGTHTAGTVGAEGNNSLGVVGVNWNVTMVAMKIGGSGTSVSGAGAVSAMNYLLALKNRASDPVNVRVTNHSWGGGGFSSTMNTAIANHASAGILTVAAAGNNNTNNDVTPFYPASYAQPNLISVANMTRFNGKSSTSNYGATSVDLFAPGTDILSTVRTSSGSYASFSGTSMASPHVAGVAALAFALAPGATYQQVRDAIFQSVDPVSSFTSLCVTGGRLNANGALSLLANVPAVPSTPDLAPASDSGVSNSDNITNDNTPTFTGTGQAGSNVLIYADGVQVGSGVVAGNGSWSVTTSALADGVRQITARAENGGNMSAPTAALAITIDTVAPSISNPVFGYAFSPHSFLVTFSENIGSTVSSADFVVQNLTSSSSVNVSASYNPGTRVATLSFPGTPVLPSGNYRLTVPANGPGGGVQDIAGNNLAADYVHDFFFLVGDANHDGRVNLQDFNIVAANFGQNLRDFTQGDFNYDLRVDLVDFNLLASNFGTALGPAPARPATFSALGGGSAVADDADDEALV